MSYPGSKAQAGVWQRIIGQMPPHCIYIEPFFGSGQVFWRKRPATGSYLLDLDPAVLNVKADAGAGVHFLCENAFEFLSSIAGRGRHPKWASLNTEYTLIYCDPPYPLSTRNYRPYYRHELNDQEHTSLLTLLQGLKCRVLISSPVCDLYSSQLRTWRCISYRTRWHDKTVTECLWCNFPEPGELHDWRYAGQNFRQRTGLKRLARRWLAKLEGMAPRKRGYVLDAIAQRYS